VIVRVRRIAWAVLALDVVVLWGLGLWLTYRYEPGGSGVSSVHQLLGVVAVLAALVGAGATVADGHRSTIAVLPAVVILAAVAGIYLTGPSLAWDQLAARGDLPADPRGAAVVFEDRVGAVGIRDRTMTAQRYRSIMYLHAVALPFGALVMGAAGLRAVRRRRQAEVVTSSSP
jgi:hypothetical protein